METTPQHEIETDYAMDAYLGAQVEILEAVELSIPSASMDHISALTAPTENVHLIDTGFGAPGGTTVFESCLDFHPLSDYIIEEEVYLTPMPSVFNARGLDLDELVVANVSVQEEMSQGEFPIAKDKLKAIYRKRKFKRDWEQIKTKVAMMNSRTGTKTSVNALFDNFMYYMDLKPQKRGGNAVAAENIDKSKYSTDSQTTNCDASAVERDHRYAAVILTQKESSPSVRDHQYNQSSAAEFLDFGSETTAKSFIKNRFKRERQLVNYMKSLFAMKKDLEKATGKGTKITLEISYEHYLFNSGNFETAEDTLSQNRRKLLRVPVVSSCDTHSSNSFANPNRSKFVMTVERVPAGNGVTPGIHVQYPNKPNATATIMRTPNANFNNNSESYQTPNPSSNTISPVLELLSLDHPYGMLPTSSKRNSIAPNHLHTNASTDEEENTSQNRFEQDVAFTNDLSQDQEDMDQQTIEETVTSQNHNLSSPRKRSVGVSTEPICGICEETTSATLSQESEGVLLWLRCFNPLCHYMVHPSCVGFWVNDMPQLLKLPPFLCPNHR